MNLRKKYLVEIYTFFSVKRTAMSLICLLPETDECLRNNFIPLVGLKEKIIS